MRSVIKNEKKSGMVLRLEVTGATVFKYTLNFIDPKEARVSEKTFSFSRGTVKLLADKRDYQKINGLLIDYVKEGEKEGFKMKNPHHERQLLQPAES
jgi:Fe-S cluster assembly iron-binding protein IscA